MLSVRECHSPSNLFEFAVVHVNTFHHFSVEFEDLWKFHAPVNTVQGFDVSLFDELIEVRINFCGIFILWSFKA